VTSADVLSEYENRIDAAQKGLASAYRYRTGTAILLGLSILLACALFSLWAVLPHWWPPLALPIVAETAWLFRRHCLTASRMYRLRLFYERGLQRVRGEWPGQGATGNEFADADHVYARDLDVFGEGSLFELLCTARCGAGRRGLAKYLLEAPPLEETLARQEAVRELSPRVDLRERVAVLGRHQSAESRWETFEKWLELPAAPLDSKLRLALLATSTALAGLTAAGLMALCPWRTAASWILWILVFHSAAGLYLRRRVNRMKGSLHVLSSETRVLREGLQLLARERFESAKLKGLAARVASGAGPVRRLELMLNALHETGKDWFYLPSLMLMLGAQLTAAIEDWRMRRGERLRDWLAAWAEFEALNSLACYAHENPEHIFPEFTEGEARFEASELGHPLLPREMCVRNDVGLNGQSRFYIISGSNMSGKSRLLRAIGLNAVLARAGAPVRAGALRLSPLSVCASISVVDSLMNGRSKFLAEVERLRQTIEESERTPVLFLIDEIFSGTNSQDRRTAAEAVVRTLIGRWALGALSTHDLKLSEIAEEAALAGCNVHMGSRDGTDPMDFDYLLKPGVTRERNALAIARMAGVPV